jgi:hypothetical protein
MAVAERLSIKVVWVVEDRVLVDWGSWRWCWVVDKLDGLLKAEYLLIGAVGDGGIIEIVNQN